MKFKRLGIFACILLFAAVALSSAAMQSGSIPVLIACVACLVMAAGLIFWIMKKTL